MRDTTAENMVEAHVLCLGEGQWYVAADLASPGPRPSGYGLYLHRDLTWRGSTSNADGERGGFFETEQRARDAFGQWLARQADVATDQLVVAKLVALQVTMARREKARQIY